MKSPSALLALLLIPLSGQISFAQAAASQAPPSFSVDVKLIRLLVTVKDAKGALIGSLERGDFSVFDCGVKQTISVFERQTELPLSVSILIDTSGSTYKDLRYEIASIEKFSKTLLGEGNPKDAAALYSFNYDVTLLSDFTRRAPRLKESLRTVQPGGGTSLYDAISLSARGLSNRDGRHVIVVVTDGGDTTSHLKYRDALEDAHLADTVIYPIVVVPITNDAGRNVGGEHALETMATETGGRVFVPSVGDELDRAFTQILRDLRTQYLIGYYPRNLPANAPHFHPVRVELSRADLRAITRTGYYGSSSR
ncbi:MAG TPA: VWA domain-containing protein [Bryobacteraceae bacterium]|nr:VWA domain-containing protein [Bryobacteraceae bacterium]